MKDDDRLVALFVIFMLIMFGAGVAVGRLFAYVGACS